MIKTKIYNFFAIIIFCAVLLCAFAIRLYAASSYITLSSYYLLPGQSFTINGAGFMPNELVTLSIGAHTKTITTNALGQFTSGPFLISFNDSNGALSISAEGVWGDSGTANLVVGTFYPQITPSNYYVMPGGQISFTGINFAPHEKVLAKVNGTSFATLTADTYGNIISSSFSAGYVPGQYTYTFTGEKSGTSSSRVVMVASFNPYFSLSQYYDPLNHTLQILGRKYNN